MSRFATRFVVFARSQSEMPSLPGPLRLIVRWLIGGAVGTGLIAITSPWFVRSYVPWRVDPVRNTWTLMPGTDYRWRSEGYATTAIGPFGMPGKTSLANSSADRPTEVSAGASPAASSPETSPESSATVARPLLRVALWGDSQAEGVCVPDDEKLFAQAQRLASKEVSLNIFPLARSGEDAAVWLTQMPAVERAWQIDVHVMLIAELPDLYSATEAPLPPISDTDGVRHNLAAYLPAFVVQSARHVLTEAEGDAPRRLRFSLGPVAPEGPSPSGASAGSPADPDWSELMRSIATFTDRPVILLYAPRRPEIIGGSVRRGVPSPAAVAAMRRAARAHAKIVVASAAPALLDSATAGAWPHGFHNGRIGSGHLNATGYRIVAKRLVQAVGQAASLSAGG